MIKLSIFCLSAFIANNAESQNYISFPDSNAVWSQQGQVALPDIPSGCFIGPLWEWIDYYDNRQFYTGSKDTLGNIIYTKILCSCASGYYCYDLNSGGSNWLSECDGFQFLYGYLREDSIKRVYFTIFPGGSEYLLYDFNWEVGDTVVFYDNVHYHLDSSNYISSIDSILIDNNYRKRFSVSRFEVYDSLLDFEHTHIIEGIGSTRGLLGNYWSAFPDTFGYGIHLICFSQKGKIFYPEVDSGACEILISVNSLPVSPNALNISPNPASDYLQIHIPAYLTDELKVINMLGEVLISKNYSGNRNENIKIDVSEIPEGSYILLLSGKQGRYTKMFVKL
ncbi:MAG: T9SS type A sorting domain-containing protein [Chitinophagales bacterium]|nr:T9SS type A sorting domain-containing protein [Chitinophagales bacterium]